MKPIKPKAFYRVSFCDLPWKENKGNFEAFFNGKMVGNLNKSIEFTILFGFCNENVNVWNTLPSKEFINSISINSLNNTSLNDEETEIINPNFKVFLKTILHISMMNFWKIH